MIFSAIENLNYMKRLFSITFLSLIFICRAFAQTEMLTNEDVVLMTQAGLGRDLIIAKIKDSDGNYDVSAKSLIELKKAGVADEVIKMMLEKPKKPALPETIKPIVEKTDALSIPVQNISEPTSTERIVLSPKEALKTAKTIALVKSSLYPTRQELEKSLLKRKDWKKYNLNLVRLKNDADLYIEVGRIPLTLISWRYVFRIYERRSGTILAAGETTAWGNLAHNLAREITQKLNKL
jgi:hypothetical protein